MTNNLSRNRTFRPALSIALIGCSVLWHVSACVYFATSGLRNDWSATPLFWMLTVMVTPAICFGGGMVLWEARKHSRFTLFEQWALVAIFLPVTVGTLLSFWAVKVLLAMSGV